MNAARDFWERWFTETSGTHQTVIQMRPAVATRSCRLQVIFRVSPHTLDSTPEGPGYPRLAEEMGTPQAHASTVQGAREPGTGH